MQTNFFNDFMSNYVLKLKVKDTKFMKYSKGKNREMFIELLT